MEQTIFAAGCFWGVQYYFDQIPGVIKTTVGYSGGTVENPSYKEVCSGVTGHAESVLIEFDANRVTFETLVRHFFLIHDPTQLNRQGPDIGTNYRSAIFYITDEQKRIAEAERDTVSKSFAKPIVTQIEQAGPFYEAEDYHQKYAEKTGQGMCRISYKPIT